MGALPDTLMAAVPTRWAVRAALHDDPLPPAGEAPAGKLLRARVEAGLSAFLHRGLLVAVHHAGPNMLTAQVRYWERALHYLALWRSCHPCDTIPQVAAAWLDLAATVGRLVLHVEKQYGQPVVQADYLMADTVVLPMLQALRSMLDCWDMGPLDPGSCSSWVADLMVRVGYDPDTDDCFVR